MSLMQRLIVILGIVLTTFAAGACSSQPAPANETTAPLAAPPAATHEGFLEKMSCDLIRGWAWDPTQPDAALTIELYDGSRLVKTTVANQFRQDLADARKGNGRHLFSESAPPELRDGKPHAIRAVVKGAGYALRPLPDTPATMTFAE